VDSWILQTDKVQEVVQA